MQCSKIFCSLIIALISRAQIHKMLVRIANREAPDQTADLGLLCLFRPSW